MLCFLPFCLCTIELYIKIHWNGDVSIIVSSEEDSSQPCLLHPSRSHKLITPTAKSNLRDYKTRVPVFQIDWTKLNPFKAKESVSRSSSVASMIGYSEKDSKDEKDLGKLGCKLEWLPSSKNAHQNKWYLPTRVYWRRISPPPGSYTFSSPRLRLRHPIRKSHTRSLPSLLKREGFAL